MKTLKVTVPVSSTLYTKDKKIPKEIEKTENITYEDGTASTVVSIPLPDKLDDYKGYENVWSKFTKWGDDSFIDDAPRLDDVILIGLKTIARSSGASRIQKAIKKAVGKTSSTGLGSGVSIE